MIDLRIIGISVIAVLVSYGVYAWNKIDYLKSENQALTVKTEFSDSQISKIKTEHEKIGIANANLQSEIEKIRKEKDELSEKLSKLQVLESKGALDKHPKMIEKAINDGTEKTFDCFNKISQGLDCQ